MLIEHQWTFLISPQLTGSEGYTININYHLTFNQNV